ncbi:Uncharacterised protein [Mycobacteroides abscessus subsp. abscessus]|nr:Uncharacterised protein [Mycobacteroides abscessus subsp. abscessus]
MKVALTPPPERRSTTPLKTWIRSLEPSITLTCTLMVSPGRKSGTSSRSDAWSTKSSVFIGDTSSRSRGRVACENAPQPIISCLILSGFADTAADS